MTKFKTDYHPFSDFAKENKLRFVATNIPRRFASLVFKKDCAALGLLKEEEKFWMAPLSISFDINLSGYKSMIGMQGVARVIKCQKHRVLKTQL